MASTHLNLSRKLRPNKFSQVIGQEMPVRMLCNGLALGKLFPTYIFSGQRGCGKTTTARIFAAALNCQNLNKNLKAAGSPIPCTDCQSCSMMAAGSHPDFMEIDAASHTGVDNVRQILETATYFPLAGNKKIYLIDEAHMLSKSAFNALLKMLEEPPSSAIFMLATTELNKVPDTVRSRCFHALFKSVSKPEVIDFLKNICKDEAIVLADGVIEMVAERCEGSLRDSLNILEQVSWACMGQDAKEQEATAAKMFGLTSQAEIFEVGQLIVERSPDKLLEKLSEIEFTKKKPELLWQNLGLFFSKLLRAKLGAPKSPDDFVSLSKGTSLEHVKALGIFFWNHEDSFLKTAHKHLFLEHLALQMASQINLDSIEGLINKLEGAGGSGQRATSTKAQSYGPTTQSFSQAPPQQIQPKPEQEKKTPEPKPNLPEKWLKFMESPKVTSDKLLESILKQVIEVGQVEGDNAISLTISGLSGFFESKLNDSKELIVSTLSQHYQGLDTFELKAAAPKPAPPKPKPKPQIQPAEKPEPRLPVAEAQNPPKKRSFYPKTRRAKAVDISDKEKWPKSNLLVKMFSGKVESAT